MKMVEKYSHKSNKQHPLIGTTDALRNFVIQNALLNLCSTNRAWYHL